MPLILPIVNLGQTISKLLIYKETPYSHLVQKQKTAKSFLPSTLRCPNKYEVKTFTKELGAIFKERNELNFIIKEYVCPKSGCRSFWSYIGQNVAPADRDLSESSGTYGDK